LSNPAGWDFISGLAFYNDVAPTALGVDLGLAFYNDVAPTALGNITA
jgi:hypothetical protein